MAKETYKVRVGGWSNRRTVIVDGGKVMLEIALSHNHCSTCAERVRYVTRKLAQRNVRYSWEYPDGAKSFAVVDAPGDGLSVERYLSELLDLNIYR